MTSVQEISSRVEDWLHGEHPYQFAKFDAMYGDELKTRRDFIADSEIPNKWGRAIILRTRGAYTLADQQLLKVCAASRAVVVYDACMAGDNRDNASNLTFKGLHRYFDSLAGAIPSTEELRFPFDLAFPSENPIDRFLRAGLLAVTGLTDSERAMGSITVPMPGLPSGQLF